MSGSEQSNLLQLIIGSVAIFGLLTFCSHVSSDAPAPAPTPAASALPGCSGLRANVLDTVEKVSKIGDVLCEAERNGYSLTVVYAEPPASITQVESLSNATAGLALDYLKTHGVDPAGDKVFLSVWSQKPEAGATGKQLWRVYGSTIYNYNSDQLEFAEQR